MKTSWPGAPHSQVSDLLKFQIQCLHFLYSGWKRNLSTLCNMLCSPKERAPGMTLRLTFPNSALGRPHLEFCGCSIQGRCQQTASSPAQGHQELLSMMRKGWEMGLFSMRKRRQGSVQRGKLLLVSTSIVSWRLKQNFPQRHTVEWRRAMDTNKASANSREVLGKGFFYKGDGQSLGWDPGKRESPSLEVLVTHTDTVLSNLI